MDKRHPAHEQDWHEVGDEHRQDVLESERDGLGQRYPAVETVNVVHGYEVSLFFIAHRTSPLCFAG